MKLAISSNGTTLDADTDPRFGRAAYFVIVDTDTLEYEAVENTQNLNRPQGAGIQAATTVVNKQVNGLITGNCGPKAFAVLQKAGVQVMLGAKGKVADVLDLYKNGNLTSARQPNVQGHWV